MASPCEVLIQNVDKYTATQIVNLVEIETLRIESKFSRFIKNNLIYRINHANGKTIDIDDETYQLFQFAHECYQLSDGLFDISSGTLKLLWQFNKIKNIPSSNQIKRQLEHVGWEKVILTQGSITLPPKMQIDLGGIGKEYAVDSAINIINKQFTKIDTLLNFGGDLCTNKEVTIPWEIGIEGLENKVIQLKKGALATSGKTKQYFKYNGKFYSHIINPKTGWPIEGAPLSITVLAANTTQAGMLATFAQLQGRHALTFLKSQNIQYWLL